MAMYTSLRVKAVVKEEYREMIQDILDGGDWHEHVEQFPFLTNYANQRRAEFIPRGVLMGEPAHWTEGKFPNELPTDGFYKQIDFGTGVWTFQCSINNDQEIELFFDEVLPNLLESAEHIETCYETWKESAFYDFKEGKIVKREAINLKKLDEEKLSKFMDDVLTPILKKNSKKLEVLREKRIEEDDPSKELPFKERRALYLAEKQAKEEKE